jgi:hypothetical protein
MGREIIRFVLLGLLLIVLAAIFSVQLAAQTSPAAGQIGSAVQNGLGPRLGLLVSAQGGPPVEQVIILLLAIGVIAPLLSVSLGLLLLGASLVTLPALGNGALSLFLTSSIFGFELRWVRSISNPGRRQRLRDVEQGIIVVSLIVLLLHLLGTALTFLLDFDPLLISSIFSYGGLHAMWRFVLSQPQPWWRALTELAGWIVSTLLLFELFTTRRHFDDGLGPAERASISIASIFNPLFLGLTFGSIIAGLTALSQIAGAVSTGAAVVFPGGVPGTFSDPAAFGAVAVLLVPLLLMMLRGPWRPTALGAAFLLAVTALWSGSCTFGLGLFVFLLWYVSGILIIGRTRRRLWPLIAILALFLAGIGSGYPPVNSELRQLPYLPPTISRALEFVNWSDGEKAFAVRNSTSREIYRVWSDHPLVGVGTGRVGQNWNLKEISAQGTRRANNYYLKILAETGAIGFVVFFISVVLFARMLSGEPEQPLLAGPGSDTKSVAGTERVDPLHNPETGTSQAIYFTTPSQNLFFSRGSLVTVLIILITGAHLSYDEFRYLTIVLLGLGGVSASSIEARGLFQARRLLSLLTLIFPVIYAGGIISTTRLHLEKGLYSPENENGRIIAWTGTSALFGLCRIDGPVTLNFRSGDPLATTTPVTIRLGMASGGDDSSLGELQVRDNEWHQLVLDNADLENKSLPVVFSLSVDRLWLQPETGRWLGAAIEWQSGLCPWAN